MNSKNKYLWEVPEFETHEFLKKKHKYCVCVFVINEGSKLLKQLERMRHLSDVVYSSR
jgi:dolichol-phosphate mannosyltransferase